MSNSEEGPPTLVSRRALIPRNMRAGLMMQIGYFSTAATAQDAASVHRILVEARVANQRDAITGLLVAGSNRYLQVIEGPSVAVERLYEKILTDPRHRALAMFSKREIAKRNFESWSLAFRRQTTTAKPDVFDAILKAYTAEIADENLQRQIRLFAQLNMSDRQARCEIAGTAQALCS